MSDYKNLYDDVTGPNPSTLHQKFTPEEIITILRDRYIDRINLSSTQQNLLEKQTSIINKKDEEIKSINDNLENINDLLFTKKRIIIYDEKDDLYNQRLIQFLKLGFFSMSLIIALLVYRKYK